MVRGSSGQVRDVPPDFLRSLRTQIRRYLVGISNADGSLSGNHYQNIIERRDKQILGSLLKEFSAVRLHNFPATGIADADQISPDFCPEAS